MPGRWDWTHETFRSAFAPVRELGFELDRVSHDAYWAVHEKELRQFFPPEAFINTAALRTEEEKQRQGQLAEARDDHPLRTFCLLRQGDELAGCFCGEQKSDSVYRMWHTHVHPHFRRKGLYRAVVAGTIAYTRELGFDSIVSEHAPGNNAVLIPKLKAGFRITGLDVHPMVGVSINLTYFHNADHLSAYLFRTGLATVNERIRGAGFGAMNELAEQLSATSGSDDSP